MPTPIPTPIISNKNSAQPIDFLNFDHPVVIWYYAGISQRTRGRFQPHVLLTLRKVYEDSLSDAFIQTAHLTSLGNARIGTIWENGLSRKKLSFPQERFTVSFNQRDYKITSNFSCWEKGKNYIIPPNTFPLKYIRDKNKSLIFGSEKGTKLVVPCLEFFYRFFGFSAELKRVLATYPWEGREGAYSRLLPPIENGEEKGKLKVKLPKKLYDDDATFLAHLKYYEHTKNVAQHIYSQLEMDTPANSWSRQASPSFIEVHPWFRGKATIEAEGMWLNSDTFLALNITGGSQPPGPPIIADRENTNRTDEEADPGAPETAWAGAAATKQNGVTEDPEPTPLARDANPQQEGDAQEVREEGLKIIGSPRDIHRTNRAKAQSRPAPKREEASSTAFSGGERYGSGEAVGYASQHAIPVLESQGTLRDIWNALQRLERERESILSTAFFHPEAGFTKAREPRLILLGPSNEGAKKSKRIYNWLFRVGREGKQRGALVAKIESRLGTAYIVELQRSVTYNQENPQGKEDSYSGLAFTLQDDEAIETFLYPILSEIPLKNGVFKNLETKLPTNYVLFDHTRSKYEQYPGQHVALKALKKVFGEEPL